MTLELTPLTGEPEHLENSTPTPPDLGNPDHAIWVKRGAKKLRFLRFLFRFLGKDPKVAMSFYSHTVEFAI